MDGATENAGVENAIGKMQGYAGAEKAGVNHSDGKCRSERYVYGKPTWKSPNTKYWDFLQLLYKDSFRS